MKYSHFLVKNYYIYTLNLLISYDLSKLLKSPEIIDIISRNEILEIDKINFELHDLSQNLIDYGISKLNIEYSLGKNTFSRVDIYSDIKILNRLNKFSINTLNEYDIEILINEFKKKKLKFSISDNISLIIDSVGIDSVEYMEKICNIILPNTDIVKYNIDFTNINKYLFLYDSSTDERNLSFDRFYNLVENNFDVINNPCLFRVMIYLNVVSLEKLAFVINNLNYILLHAVKISFKLYIPADIDSNEKWSKKFSDLIKLLNTNAVKCERASLEIFSDLSKTDLTSIEYSNLNNYFGKVTACDIFN